MTKDHLQDVPSDAELRCEPRYLCGGRAGVKLPGHQREDPGTILDLSMSGCRIRLEEAAALEVDTDIEINLQSDYLAFRAIASVRFCGYGNTVLGLLFRKLTAAGRDDLHCLIRDLKSR